jgi:RNA polymerase sigma-70 factor (ECF subfamily)
VNTDARADRIRDEKDLVEQLRQGRKHAFDVLVARFQKPLLKVAYGITLDVEESREIVQDVFTTVFRQIHSFRQDVLLYTWLRKITVNHCLNWKRKWKRRFRWHHDPITAENENTVSGKDTPLDTPETLIQKKQFRDRLMEAVRDLPAKKPVTLWTDRFFRRPVRPFLVAAASLAALFVIAVFALTNDGPAIAGPSAIVKSIDTDYTAVMIFETPETHHTIIWYSET